jgi:hypothetical protein
MRKKIVLSRLEMSEGGMKKYQGDKKRCVEERRKRVKTGAASHVVRLL